ncbi:hypothetical protein [Sorangium sp. So ce341]
MTAPSRLRRPSDDAVERASPAGAGARDAGALGGAEECYTS